MASKTRQIKEDSADKQDVVMEGNKMIGLFIGDINVKIFDDSSYWLAQPFHTSWDSIMGVIKKIKTIVYDGGYDILTAKHYNYVKICNACYDADLDQAWMAVVKWINFHYYLEEVEKTKLSRIYANKQQACFKIASSLNNYNPFGSKSSPIEITNDILVRNQLKRINEKVFIDLTTNEPIEARYDIKYVHQLNNIYWQATGKELESFAITNDNNKVA